MEWLAQQKLLRWFDFYLAVAFVFSSLLRIHHYLAVLRILWALPQRWPRLLALIHHHHRLLISWNTLRPLLATLGLWLGHTLLRRLVLENGADLTVAMLLQHWLAVPVVIVSGVAMLCYDTWGALTVGEVNRREIEGYFDQAEYWLGSWAAPAVQIFTLGWINPRRMVHQEVQTALGGATDTINGTLWWMTIQMGLRIAFGLSLWLTYAWSRW